MTYLPSRFASSTSTFHVNATGSIQNFAVSSPTVIEWTTEVWDVGNEFNLGTEEFVATTSGRYDVRLAMSFASGESGSLFLRINGSPVKETPQSTGGAYGLRAIVELTSGDALTGAFTRNSGGDGTISDDILLTRFEGFLIHEG